MRLLVEGSTLRGPVDIPGSKSHTIRAVAIAALAEGKSHIRMPLASNDTRAAFKAYRAFGAEIDELDKEWVVQGTGGSLQTPPNVIDTENSGTTMNVALASAALVRGGITVLTGDDQVRR